MDPALCSVVVCSCDKYSDLWYPYFELFKKFWGNCPYPIYLNTETKEYKTQGLSIHVIHAEEGKTDWSSRLIHTINKSDSEFILLTLDDHFLLRPVDEKAFCNLVSYMDAHPQIACMSFLTKSRKKQKLLHGRWIKIGKSELLRVTASTALWRKERLLSLLCAGESAWEFEGGASNRSRKTPYLYYRYEGAPDWPDPILDFAQHVYRGYGVFQGKWLWNNDKLFRENGLAVDLSLRGTWNKEEFCKFRQKGIEANTDWRESPTFWANLYRRTPKWILKLGSRIKRLFKKD